MKNIIRLYKKNKSAKVNEQCICPSCGSKFVKVNYQQAFCKNRKGTQCKDKYWNTVDPKKRNNTTRISPASKKFTDNRKNNNWYQETYHDRYGEYWDI